MVYGVPQGSILGPVLFNLYVVDMSTMLKNTCLQYADDTNLYGHCKPQKLLHCATDMEHDLENLSKWSEDNNLSFNCNKTKTMLFATNHVIRRFNLDDGDAYQLNIQGNSLERVIKSKILGVMFNQSLSWGDHVNNILKSCYSTLKSLSRLKKLTPFKLRKQLSEMLILSKVDYCSTVYADLPNYF